MTIYPLVNKLPMFYPLVNIQKVIENGPVEIVDLPSYKMVDLSIVMYGKSPFLMGISTINHHFP